MFMFQTFGEFTEFAMEILNYAAIVLDVILVVFFSWFYIVYICNALRRTKRIQIKEPKNKFAVLVAARNESRVIRNILDSLKAQDYPKELFDVYVIVETEDDPTVKITEEYGDSFHIVVRGDLEGRRTKGYALDDAYKHIKKSGKVYDAYMIFDADNIASKNYLSTMNSIKLDGVQIGVGYRNYTNATKNWISVTSGILFSFMNAFTSKGRTKLFDKATLTGTGYFVDAKIVDDAGGWIWNGMTEDVELTYYAYQNHIKMKYYPKIEYYDEQPTTYKVLHTQHVRWVWGYFSNMRKKFKNYKFDYTPNEKKSKRFWQNIEHKFGIYPFLTFVIFEVVLFIVDFILGFVCIGFSAEHTVIINAFVFGIYHLFIAYIAFVLVAFLTVLVDNHNLKLNFWKCLQGIITYPIFFVDFLFAFLDGLFHKKKRTNWKVIEHSGDVVDKKAIESKKEK